MILSGPARTSITTTLAASDLAPALIACLTDPDALRPTTDNIPCTWDTPDATGVVVHPSVRFFPDGVSGFTWWAAATPYANTNNQVENPCIYVSRDGVTWAPPPGVTNPLVSPPANGFNSDPCLTRAPDGELLLFYREYQGIANRVRLLRSTDGVTWTGPITVLETVATASQLLSPAIWWDAPLNAWVLLAVEIQTTPRQIHRYTAAAPEGPWTFDDVVSVTPAWEAGRSPWHLDALVLGDQVLALVHEHETAATGIAGAIYLATSEDGGQSFTRATRPLRGQGAYKSALLPLVSERGLGVDLWVGQARAEWGVEKARAWAAVPAPDRFALPLEMGLGTHAIPPYVAADTFDRADSTTGLGTSSSGHVWTPDVGTLGIVDGWAVPPASGNNRATFNTGIANAEISATFDTSAVFVGRECWLLARWLDGDNFLRAGVEESVWLLQKVEAGGVTTLATGGSFPDRADHRCVLRCIGSSVELWLNGERIASVTEPFNQTATRFGIQQIDTMTRLDDLLVRAL